MENNKVEYYEVMDYDENYFVVESHSCHPDKNDENIFGFYDYDGNMVFNLPSSNLFCLFHHVGELPIKKKTFKEVIEENKPPLYPPCDTFTTAKEFKSWIIEQKGK
jgi:hypothetical protein